jgi:hypothetical protein
MAKNYRVTSTRSLVRLSLDFRYFNPEKGVTAIPVTYVEGGGKLVVAVGDNASGKSFYRRIVQCVCHYAKIECIHLSMQARTNFMGNAGLAFVYGSEEWQSTGENSSHTVLGAIATSKSRKERNVIFWDEPDLGLSDNWSASVGVTIRKFMKDAPDPLVAAIVVTHNKALLQELTCLNPHFLCFGEEPAESLKEWLDRPVKPLPLEKLKETSRKRFKLIQAILDDNKKKRDKDDE